MARKPIRAPRRREAKIAFDAITIEGALLQPELVTRIAAADPNPKLATDYGLDPGERLREVVQTKFTLAQSLHARFQGSDKGAVALKRFLSNLFAQVFEFTDLAEIDPIVTNERVFPIGHQALGGRVPIVFAPWEAIDKGAKTFGEDGRQRAPAQLLQEYLNAEDKALWGLVCDGRAIRLYRDNAAMTRPAYIEADLTMLFDAEAPRLADFSALWLLVHASRFGKPGTPPADCALERWREDGREKGARAREELRGGVEQALSLLGQGFLAHPANNKLKDDLAKGALSPQAYLDALLRLVYRLIFVFAAEDRDLLHLPQPQGPVEFERWRTARDFYKKGYSLDRLRALSTKRHAWDRNVDGWQATKVLFRELWRGQPSLALPALGGLFAPGLVRDFADCQIANQYLYAAIFHLAWLRTSNGLERINWRDMETEELGSVYESLLELTPDLSDTNGFAFIDAAGHERKTTASYYTPDSLVQALLDETLEPLIAERIEAKNGRDAIEALLDLRIIDPACGSGHFLLAAARRLAVKCAHLDKPGEAPSPADFRHWLREVARRCLYGVDKNPMAIELAKVALWIETVEPGKPLSFLDAHLRCGDALLGVYDLGVLNRGIPDEAYKPLTGDVKAAATDWRKRNKAERDARNQGEFSMFEPPREVLEAARALEAAREDALAEVEAKAQHFRALLAGPDRYRMEVACDLYVAAFLLPKTLPPARHTGDPAAYIPTSRDVWDKLAGRQPHGLLEGKAISAAKAAHTFHWPLEFPQVFFPGAGQQPRFDVALGNPPWEVNQLGEEEYFASKAPAVARLSGKARKDAIMALESSDPHLWSTYQADKRNLDGANEFFRVAGRFTLTAAGKINTYSLFAELFAAIARRAGIVVPTELATSDSSKAFFNNLVESGRLRSLYDFQTGMGFFDRIGHARFKFALFALGDPRRTGNPKFKVSFFLRTAAEMADKSRYFEMSRSDIAAINPNTRTAPIFRSKVDADLTRQIYARVPVLIHEAKGTAGNPWGVEFRQGLFNMTSDSGLFRTARQLQSAGLTRDGRDWVDGNTGGRYAPLQEAKMIHHYDHRWATYEDGIGDKDSRNLELTEKEDAHFEVAPRYWVADTDVTGRLATVGWTRGWFLGFRDVCRATDERTVIVSAFPKSAVGNNLPLCFASPDSRPDQYAGLIACISSLTLDFVARHKVGGTHLNFFIAEQLPVLAPSAFTDADLAFIVPRVLELCYTSHSMKTFADDLGFKANKPFPWDEDRRALLRAELDAKIAGLYRITRDQLRYILDPADVYGANYSSETFRVLKKNEIAKYGDYRTGRLVLDAWDRLERGELQ